MLPIEFFKLQAKNLLKDYKTQETYVDQSDGNTYFRYSPSYFDIERIFLEFDWDEKHFSLMKSQHFIARILGFNKWGELIAASKDELELAKLLWDNQHKICLEDWESYIDRVEHDNGIKLDFKHKIEIFRRVFVEVEGHHNVFGDYRLKKQS